jgi:calcineurin-like phosphoesterase
MPMRFTAAERGASIFATLVGINPETRRAERIERIHIPPE